MANTSRITSTSMDWFKVAEEAYEYASQLLPEISQSKLNIISDTAKKNLAIQFNDIEHPIVEALLSKKVGWIAWDSNLKNQHYNLPIAIYGSKSLQIDFINRMIKFFDFFSIPCMIKII